MRPTLLSGILAIALLACYGARAQTPLDILIVYTNQAEE